MAVSGDVIVVGAGVAGVAAAQELAAHGVASTIVEARPRALGRVATFHPAGWPEPVELGAEFAHDEAPATRDLAREAGVALETVPEEHFWLEHGRAFRTPDMDALLADAVSRERKRRTDRSLADVFEGMTPERRRHLEPARFFAQGYHAADAALLSAKALAHALAGTDRKNNVQRRPVGGNSALLSGLLRGLPPPQLGTAVTRVTWRRGRVRVACRSAADGAPRRALEGRACIVTAPLAVLRTRAITFDPLPTGWEQALARLGVGTAQKLVFRFRYEFWRDSPVWQRRPSIPTFWHARDVPVPTWWTTAPRDSSVLTAWAGGPAAASLAALGESEIVARASASLAHMLGVSPVTVEDQLLDVQRHDWMRDPFSLGAYAYVGVGGRTAQQELAQVVDGTLVLAGEALSVDAIGTVEGAIESGRRAARALLRKTASAGRRSTPAAARRSGRSRRR